MNVASPTRKEWILRAMALGFTMTLIDATVVSVALSTIQRDLHLSGTERAWVVNAYLLALAVTIAAAGKFADVLGRKRIFLVGLAIFTGASACCGLATDGTVLLLARCAEGVGSALMTPTSQALVSAAFPRNERGRALGIYSGISAMGIALGPLLGGVLTTFLNWRWIFYINLPIGVVTFLLTLYANPQDERLPQAERIDWAGLVSLICGLSALIIALMQGGTWGWSSATFLLVCGAGVIALVIFAVVEVRVQHPLLNLRIFAEGNFLGDTLVMFLVRFALFGLSVYLPIFLQDVLGFSAFVAGLATLPATLLLFLAALPAGRLYDRAGARLLLGLGTAVTAVSFLWLSLVAFPTQSYLLMVPALLLCGCGIACATGPALTDAMNAAPLSMQGEVAGTVGTVQQVGGAVGTAVVTAIVSSLTISRLIQNLSALGVHVTVSQLDGVLAQATVHKLPAGVTPQMIGAAKDAFTSALSTSYLLIAVLLIAASALSWLLIRRIKDTNRRKDDATPIIVGG
jgi:EmrB/QacA subfamily drug resistance transporter